MYIRKTFEEDIFYSKLDLADEIYFIYSGKIALYFDISQVLDMNSILKEDQHSFNIPLVIF